MLSGGLKPMTGDYIGEKTVGPSKGRGKPGFNAKHPILHGIKKLYEGVTIAGLPEKMLKKGWVELMRASDRRLLTAYLEPRKGKHGPVVVHGAYTQLMPECNKGEPGQEPFVRNLGTYTVLRDGDTQDPDAAPRGMGWVSYSGDVCGELEEQFYKWKHEGGPKTHTVDLYNRIPSTGDEKSLGGHYIFDIDFQKMQQTAHKAGGKRPMLRRMLSDIPDATPAPPTGSIPESTLYEFYQRNDPRALLGCHATYKYYIILGGNKDDPGSGFDQLDRQLRIKYGVGLAKKAEDGGGVGGETAAAYEISGATGKNAAVINGIYDEDSSAEHLYKKRDVAGVWLYLDRDGQVWCVGDDRGKNRRTDANCAAKADVGDGPLSLLPRLTSRGMEPLAWRCNQNSRGQRAKYKTQGAVQVKAVKGRAVKTGGKPLELAMEDALTLHEGQLIQTSKKSDDGTWAFGSVIFDPVENRHQVIIEGDVLVDDEGNARRDADGNFLRKGGVAAVSGWFPLSHTRNPTPDQLQQLQDRLGGGAAATLKVPSEWEAARKAPSNPLMAARFVLPEGGPEWAMVVDRFLKGDDNVPGAAQYAKIANYYPSIKVVKVERIENVSMWQSYAVKRQSILQREEKASSGRGGDAGAARFERIWLFHGTSADTVPKIIQQGFNRAFCGKNACAYGKGVYFARDASYSASTTYSRPDANGVQRMFLCRVVVGEYCQGKNNMLTPDVREGHQLYDSTVDTVTNAAYGPSIFVTYHDAQAYPEYLVHFKQ